MTPPRVRADMIEPMARAERIDPAERAEPIESTEPKDPIEPIERADPTEPIDSTEFLEAIESTEPLDRTERREGAGGFHRPIVTDCPGRAAGSPRGPSGWCAVLVSASGTRRASPPSQPGAGHHTPATRAFADRSGLPATLVGLTGRGGAMTFDLARVLEERRGENFQLHMEYMNPSWPVC